jgi:phosphotransferase system enzyme I (PtsI)
VTQPTTGSLPQTITIDGQSASPGVAHGRAFFSLAGLDELEVHKLRDEEIVRELARVDSAARAARVSLVHQRSALGEHFTAEQRRIFDTHLAMLEDPVLEADLRGRIINERLNFESALKDMIGVYERLFEVVQSASLRNKLVDMRDIALRLLRFAKPPGERARRAADMKGGILVVRELSLSDLTEALEQGIAGLVAEEGNLASHGVILTRAAGIPAVIGVGGIHEQARAGDPLLVDGDSGQVVLNPPPDFVALALGRQAESAPQVLGAAMLADGSPVMLMAAAASLAEVRQAVAMGVREIGLYRTELPVIQREGAAREEVLVPLYRQVAESAATVTFRLPDLDSTVQLEAVYPVREANPALGLRGVRVLLAQPALLEPQLRAMLRAAAHRRARIAVPFINDVGDLRAVRAIAERVREELRLEGAGIAQPPQIGVVIETPSAALESRELMAAADFALIGLDSFAQLLLAADVRCAYQAVRERIQSPHPVVLRAVRKLARYADGLDFELGVYGECLAWPGAVELLVGVGLRRFVVRTALLPGLHERLAALDPDLCERVAEQAARAVTREDLTASLPPSWQT